MKKITLFLFLIFVCVVEAQPQNTTTDVTVNVTGLSEEYAAKFKNTASIKVFVTALNNLNIEYNLSPIVITVTYNNGQGFINVTVKNYSPLEHFNLWQYKRHDSEMRSMGGVGISLLFQEKILTAVTEYKLSVARDGWTIDNDIAGFANVVTLSKANGDLAIFSGYNYRQSNGSYPFIFYTNVELLISGRYMKVVTENTKALNNLAFFEWGKTSGMDGKPTTSYFMSEFFKPTKEEQEELTARKKAEEEAKAKAKVERKKQEEQLKNECIQRLLRYGDKLDFDILKANFCFLSDGYVYCKKDGVTTRIGDYAKRSIQFVGNENNIRELIQMDYKNGVLEFSTVNNMVVTNNNEMIKKMFNYQSGKITLYDSSRSSYYLPTNFSSKLHFEHNIRNNTEALNVEVSVKNKKGKLEYKVKSRKPSMTTPYKKNEDEALLANIKKSIIEQGEYLYRYTRQEGIMSIYSEGVCVSKMYPVNRITLIQNGSSSTQNNNIEYYTIKE